MKVKAYCSVVQRCKQHTDAVAKELFNLERDMKGNAPTIVERRTHDAMLNAARLSKELQDHMELIESYNYNKKKPT